MSKKKEQEKIKKIHEFILRSIKPQLPLEAEVLELSNRTRFRLEETRFFLGKMESNLQNRIEFRFYLDAFLASARSIFHVFEKEFHDNKLLMDWYKGKATGMKKNKILKFFIELRNISLKEHTPDTRTRASVTWGVDVILSKEDVKRVIDSDGKEHYVTPPLPLEVKDKKVIGYAFLHNIKSFDENPDVMSLCTKYLGKLDRFVSEMENMEKGK